MFPHRTIFPLGLCLIAAVVSQEPCSGNGTCSCNVVGNITDMSCQLTVPFAEIQADDTAIRTLTLTAGPSITRAEAKFMHLQVQHLVITGISISELDCFILDGMFGLESISIEHTKLSIVPTCVLRHLDSVTSLKLVNSHITSLSRRAFAVSPGLKHLNLSGNCISNLRSDTFADLHNLESLDLSANCLSGELTSAILMGVPKLKVLRVERNYISSIRGKFWQNLTNLEYLNLSENSITGLIDLSFHPRYNFVLSVSSNDIKVIENFLVRFVGRASEMSNFTLHLDAAKNKLEQFPVINVEGPRQCQLLFDVNVENNNIIKFDRDPVLSSACIDRIKLRVSLFNNRIASFPPCHSYILQKFHFLLLNLSANHIDGNFNTLCGANEVETLDISKNMLNVMGSISAANTKTRLQRLLLEGNQISVVRGSNIGQIFSDLKLLDLSNNAISSVVSLVEMPDSLRILKLAGNPLMCNSSENELFDFDTLCKVQNIMDKARCGGPLELRGYQARCVLAENCSTPIHSEICSNDTYLEIHLSVRTSAFFSLHTEWQLVGPGEKNIEILFLELGMIHVPDNELLKTVRLHTLAHEFTFTSLQPDILYRVCVRATMSSSREVYMKCVLAQPTRPRESEQPDTDFKTLSAVLGALLGVALVVVACFIFRVAIRRRDCCKKGNEYNARNSVIEEYVDPASILEVLPQGSNDKAQGHADSIDLMLPSLKGDHENRTELYTDNENVTSALLTKSGPDCERTKKSANDRPYTDVKSDIPSSADNKILSQPRIMKSVIENGSGENGLNPHSGINCETETEEVYQETNGISSLDADKKLHHAEIHKCQASSSPPLPPRTPCTARNGSPRQTRHPPQIHKCQARSSPPRRPLPPRTSCTARNGSPRQTRHPPQIHKCQADSPPALPPPKPSPEDRRHRGSALLHHTQPLSGSEEIIYEVQAGPKRGSSENIRLGAEAISQESVETGYEPMDLPGSTELPSNTSDPVSDKQGISTMEETEPKVTMGRRDSAYDSLQEGPNGLQGVEITNPLSAATNSIVEIVDAGSDEDDENNVLLAYDDTELDVNANDSAQQTITNPNYRHVQSALHKFI